MRLSYLKKHVLDFPSESYAFCCTNCRILCSASVFLYRFPCIATRSSPTGEKISFVFDCILAFVISCKITIKDIRAFADQTNQNSFEQLGSCSLLESFGGAG